METGGTTPVAKDKEKFKSYYVVWKRIFDYVII